ncbi:hypothetical protein GG344DRAFT_56148 [Lentinula edodes]|nr:hypothetical protein GG344DRAFT_56148 [Lentinula edodes]
MPASFDFANSQICAWCKQSIEPPKKPLRCSACKAPIYCSAKVYIFDSFVIPSFIPFVFVQCAKRDWKTPAVPNAVTHKVLCTDNKRHMQRLPEVQAVLKSFPWGRLESDGTFSSEIARGRFDVLGGSGYGFWSHRGGPIPHQLHGDGAFQIDNVSHSAQFIQTMLRAFDHLDGSDLLKTRHLTDEEGWKLPRELIPFRDITQDARRPMLVTQFQGGVVDWDSWYRWRNLPKMSPAALLMDFPMSVYQMLVHCLEITSPNAGSEIKPVNLDIYFLGVEVELNFLPLFSEIALLLPYHNLRLTLFGPGVRKFLDEAKKHPSSIAAKSRASGNPIFSYTAPPECGSSTINIHLSGNTTWFPNPHTVPDAIVACNAGLASYPEWVPIIRATLVLGIPFATTEYCEQSAEAQRNFFPMLIRGSRVFIPLDDQSHKIELNPFHRPGQRVFPMYSLPNLVNGFTLVVYKSKAVDHELTGEIGRGRYTLDEID